MTTTTISSGTTSPGLTITSGNGVDVLNGGTVTNAVVQAGSTATNSAGTTPVLTGPAGVTNAAPGLIIELGGVDNGSTINAGAVELVIGAASGDRVSGLQFVSGATATVSNETVVAGGVVDLYLKGAVATNLTIAGGALNISGNAVASNTTLSNGSITFQSPKAVLSGSLLMQGNANTLTVAALQSPGSAGLGDQAVISGFVTGDVIDITAVTSGGTISSTSATNGATETVNVTSGGTTIETFQFTAGSTALLRADANGFAELVACYCPGTLILTEAGEVPVERLHVGDQVVTVSGALEPIRWIGRRSYHPRTLAGRTHLLPIRIKAGALADGTPRRDLLVSPLHAMLIDGVLVPAHALLNGTTVVREQGMQEVSYVHIELAQHDVVWAEGAASETFVDDDGRFIFQSVEGDAVSQPGEAAYYAPRVDCGYRLQGIRDRIASRVGLLAA